MKPGLTVLVCGDRDWDDVTAIRDVLETLPDNTRVVYGDCRGADKIAGAVAAGLNLQVKTYPAQWARFGSAAGPIRNADMLRIEKPSVVLAFYGDIAKSKGTVNMIKQAVKAGKQVFLYDSTHIAQIESVLASGLLEYLEGMTNDNQG